MTDDLVVDQRGRRCPLPVIELARRITDVEVGGVVVLISDDPASASDVPAWCAIRGHDLVAAVEREGSPAFRVRRSV